MAQKAQNKTCVRGYDCIPWEKLGRVRGRVRSMRIAANIATTPPNLLGMERRIAYAQRKYHSGLIWMGVTRGFAGVKFSGSPNRFGMNITIKSSLSSIIKMPRISLEV